MRNKFIAGNWKMYKTYEEVLEFIKEIEQVVGTSEVRVGICAPSVYLKTLVDELQDKNIDVFAQNVYYEDMGAFTGEISVDMLKSIGVKGSIVGHSERRNIFFESDRIVNEKVKALVRENMECILCLGENFLEREKEEAFEVVQRQLIKALKDVTKEEINLVIIAYEPIWAIGTGKVATSEEAETMCNFIRKNIESMYGEEVAENIIIQYGGSVKGENAKEILNMPNIDGALVGGASLKVESFKEILNYR